MLSIFCIVKTIEVILINDGLLDKISYLFVSFLDLLLEYIFYLEGGWRNFLRYVHILLNFLRGGCFEVLELQILINNLRLICSLVDLRL